jgi:ubiquinone/menaquinone biosynthesis C-methylase UbiE
MRFADSTDVSLPQWAQQHGVVHQRARLARRSCERKGGHKHQQTADNESEEAIRHCGKRSTPKVVPRHATIVKDSAKLKQNRNFRGTAMRTEIRSAIDFYEHHPISCDIILAKLGASRGHLDGLSPEELLPHDQDHYGGLAANDALAERAHIGEGTRVADFCAGLGGPSRYFAHRYGADVTGIELTPARVRGAEELTRRVGLQHKVRIIEGNVMQVPLPDASVDVVISQEALLHVPDKLRALQEARRILKPGGRLAFTDWVAHRPLSDRDKRLMWDGMAVTDLYDLSAYAELIGRAGFTASEAEDLTREWGEILRHRLAMYQRLREETQAAGTPAGHDAFYESYVRFVELVNAAVLGGGRFAGQKPG